MGRFIALLSVLFAFTHVQAATCVALVSGTWESPATWSCGHAPTCGDSLVIPATFTVTVTAVDNYIGTCVSPAMQIVVVGELDFVTGKKLELPCGSAVYIYPGGVINPGGGGGSSNLISICNANYWTAGAGPLTGPGCLNCTLPLPIQLVSFGAVCNNTGITLSWQTASEVNNKYFTVERSEDGNTWTPLIDINGAGTSSVPHYYTWQDMDPLPGTSYYQLKQTDYDGNHTYSWISPANCANTNHLVSLYPNPSFNGNMKCNINSSIAQNITVTITNELGQMVMQQTNTIQQGLNTEQLAVSNLNSGVYIMTLVFENDNTVIHKKFVISK